MLSDSDTLLIIIDFYIHGTFCLYSNASFRNFLYAFLKQGRRKTGGGQGGVAGGTPSQCFLEQNFFSHVKSENIAFLHVNNVSDFSLFVEQDISDKK